jgi:hypothetical protein
MDNELEKMSKNVVVACFSVLSLRSARGTKARVSSGSGTVIQRP